MTGFKKIKSVPNNLARVLNEVRGSSRNKAERNVITAIELSKAYDSVDRSKLFAILKVRA